MKTEHVKYLNKELKHIFESGVNKSKIIDMINVFMVRFKMKEIPMDNYVPYQLCPVCRGQYRHETCETCKGEKIIPMYKIIK